MTDNTFTIYFLEVQIKLLQHLIDHGKKGDMEKMIKHFKSRIEDLKKDE